MKYAVVFIFMRKYAHIWFQVKFNLILLCYDSRMSCRVNTFQLGNFLENKYLD